MKSGTENLIKFSNLKARLSRPLYQVRGLLDTLWSVTGDNAPFGDIGSFSNQEIARSLEWDGDPDDLVAALLETRWLDGDSVCRLVVHDWSDHCEDRIKMRVARGSGVTFKELTEAHFKAGREARHKPATASATEPRPEPTTEPAEAAPRPTHAELRPTQPAQRPPQNTEKPAKRNRDVQSLTDLIPGAVASMNTPEAMLDRIQRLTGEPHWRDWWGDVIARLAGRDALHILHEALDRTANATDPAKRSSKDVGKVDDAGKFLVSIVQDGMKEMGIRWPKWPTVEN